ncbi:alpha/beta-hydrolase [Microstroma glucosiphilum]|uniref:Alpha/beta-hydrolase n=1 Tax=Pseudomicrostroma glucosiphilum TaxID=1684307 RepID=A0A316U8V9_9BASI|nr:alpha/beta-hydrolase [Pseudomicrostroma glucosiphilum]PWN21619.1 alpha/beta-hydrolase [Pseudomicrostroma glucosiphilum]
MIDHLLGRPSTSLKRLQVLAVLAFWGAVLKRSPREGPARSKWIRWANKRMGRYSPWKVVLSTLMCLYAFRHVDAVFGFGAPEPLAAMYSRSFYRVTWIVTALDAGFATAMNVRPIWLRDLLSVIFSAYYIVFANEADEKLRRYRAFCTLDMMRYTWEKTSNNPYVRLATWFHRPSLPIARPILLPRPTVGAHSKRPINAWLFYASGKEAELAKEEELYLDFPGGGFICMSPRDHEERLRQLAKEMERPVLAIDYCKAPEYPYPFALEECFDVYRTLIETRGKAIGMSGSSRFRMILSGDSAGGNLATGVMLKILEYPQPHIKSAFAALSGSPKPPPLPKPLCMILAYPSLNFSFTAWMQPDHLRVLKAQSEVNLQNLQMQAAQAEEDSKAGRKGSPLRPRSRSRSRQSSSASLSGIRAEQTQKALQEQRQQQQQDKSRARTSQPPKGRPPTSSVDKSYTSLANQAQLHLAERARFADAEPASDDNASPLPTPQYTTAADTQDRENLAWQSDLWYAASEDEERQRQLAASQQKADAERSERRKKTSTGGTRLTMTSMAGYFQDRILTQSMMRSMALLYVGPRRQPDFDKDYLLSPIVAPAKLLAEFPPVLFICGEKDPICDDTVVFAGRIREAKLAKQAEIKSRRAGASARFGEGLRMSVGGPSRQGGAAEAEAAAVDPIEEEDVEDWVQMRIIASVSHGLLQMVALWPEAKHIISFISAWSVETFEEEEDRLFELRQQQEASRPTKAQTLPVPSGRGHDGSARQGRQGAAAGAQRTSKLDANGQALDGGVIADEEDDDEPLSFTPKRMRSPSVQSPRSPAGDHPATFGGAAAAAGSSSSARSPQWTGHGNGSAGPPKGPLQLPAIAALKGEPPGVGASGGQGTAPSIDKQQGGGSGSGTSGSPSSNGNEGRTPSARSTTAPPGAATTSSRNRPSSFSDVRATRAHLASAAGLRPPPAELEASAGTSAADGGVRRSSFGGISRSRSPIGGGGGVNGSSHGGGGGAAGAAGSGSTTARGTGVGLGAEKGTMDSRTRALLINEESLLQRRRDEAILGLQQGGGGGGGGPNGNGNGSSATGGSASGQNTERGRGQSGSRNRTRTQSQAHAQSRGRGRGRRGQTGGAAAGVDAAAGGGGGSAIGSSSEEEEEGSEEDDQEEEGEGEEERSYESTLDGDRDGEEGEGDSLDGAGAVAGAGAGVGSAASRGRKRG